jgi:hypothetical protein
MRAARRRVRTQGVGQEQFGGHALNALEYTVCPQSATVGEGGDIAPQYRAADYA